MTQSPLAALPDLSGSSNDLCHWLVKDGAVWLVVRLASLARLVPASRATSVGDFIGCNLVVFDGYARSLTANQPV